MKNMKTFQIIALSLSMALALTGCNKDNDPTLGTEAADSDLIRIVPTIAATNTGGDASASTTRAAIDEATGKGSFQSGDVIGVYARPFEPPTLDFSGIFRTATFDGTAWTYNTPLRWSDVPEDQDGKGYLITGHYPLQTATPDDFGSITFSVQTDQSTPEAYRASDLLMSGAIDANGYFDWVFVEKGKPVNLNFLHAMSRIQVRLTAGSNVSAEEVNAATVKIKNMRVNNNINIVAGSLDAPLHPVYADITLLKSTTAAATFYAVIAAQQTIPGGEDWIEVTFGDRVVTYPAPTNILLKENQMQRVNLTLSRSGTRSATRGRSSMGRVADDGLGELILECTSMELKQ